MTRAAERGPLGGGDQGEERRRETKKLLKLGIVFLVGVLGSVGVPGFARQSAEPIKDMRKDFGNENLPFVIATSKEKR